MYSLLLSYPLNKLLNYKLVFYVHSYGLPTNTLMKKMMQSCDRVVGVSEDVIDFFPYELPNAQVIYNGVAETNNLELHKKCDFIYVGRLSEEKGCMRLLQAFGEVLKSKATSRLLIVGDGPQKEELAAYVRTKGLESQVDFTGWLKNPQQHLHQAKFLCLFSDTEGFGLALAEAMMAGIPCLGTPVAGIRTVIRNDLNGYLSESLSIADLAKLMKRAFSLSEDEYRRLSESAANYARLHFSLEKQAALLEKTLTEI